MNHCMSHYKVLIDSASWECLPNLVSCSKIYRYMIQNGHQITDDASESDFIIINTCGVFEKSENFSIDLFKKYSKLKKDDAKIIMVGCLVKINKRLIESLGTEAMSYDELEKLDNIFYNNIRIEDVHPACEQNVRFRLRSNKMPYDLKKTAMFKPNKFLEKISKAFINNYKKMMEDLEHKNKIYVEIVKTGTGCTGNCSYCVIKKAKKKIDSKTPEMIMEEIKNLYTGDSKKLLLIADDCGSYGIDKGWNLPFLIHKIHENFPNLSISLNFLNPKWFQKQKEEYLKIFREIKIDSIQVTLQSGSNKIIKKMNRHYNVKEVISTINEIKKISSGTLLYSHFIVGFPGETTSNFLKTFFAVRYFDANFPFKYEDREGAESVVFPDKKSRFVIDIRYRIILTVIRFYIIYYLLKKRD